ncbi:MAG TPA: DbpA RNA binding domain-containing protein, partial [Vulgatibacter sp.]
KAKPKPAAKGRERKAEGEKRERKGRGEKRAPRKESGELSALTPPDHVPVAPGEELDTPPVAELEKPRSGKLWISLGQDDGLDAEGVKAALAEASGADAADVERIEVRSAHSFAYVRPGKADAFLAANGKVRGEKELKVEKARRSRR